MVDLPAAVREYLHARLLEECCPAYLLSDRQGRLVACGGRLSRYGIAPMQPGEDVCAAVDCLLGSLPLDGPPIHLRAVQLDAERFADILIFASAEGDYVLFLDASEQARNRRDLQQRTNELALLRQADDIVSAELLSALGIAAFEYREDGLVDLISRAPDWLRRFWPQTASAGRGLDPGSRFPFLEHFLFDARKLWQSAEPEAIKSGLWLENDAAGVPCALEATALKLGPRHMLLITHAGDEYQQHQEMIQKARESRLDAQRQTERLLKSNLALKDFAGMASHDLQAPLRSIAALSRWIEADLGAPLSGDAAANMALLRSRVTLMQQLISDLLAYSLVGRVAETIETVDTEAMVQELIVILGPPASFVIEVSADMPTLDTVKTPLQLVFRNLIGNAIKHHGRVDGRVAVTADDAGAFYEFQVSDDGQGIPREFQERAFLPFHALDSGAAVKGNGMGLALVQRTVQQYGGHVELDSELGRGSTFRFTWPKMITRAGDGA